MTLPMENTEDVEAMSAALDQLADTPMPPSTVDVELALTTGRRSLRRRRFAGAAGAVAITLAGAVLASTALSGAGGTNGTAPASVPAGVDPVTVDASFGWLPAGIKFDGSGVYPDSYSINAARAGGDVSVSLGSSGAVEPIPAGSTQIGTIDGHPVVLIGPDPEQAATATPPSGSPTPKSGTSSLPSGPLLIRVYQSTVWWQPSPGLQLSLTYRYMKSAEKPSNATMMHIARTIHFGTRRIPLPFSVSGLSRAQLQIAFLSMDGSQTMPIVQVGLKTSDGYVSIDVRAKAQTVPKGFPQPLGASKKINGLVYTVSFALNTGYSTKVAEQLGTARQILDRIVSYGPDEQNWTTNVLTP